MKGTIYKKGVDFFKTFYQIGDYENELWKHWS